MKIGQQVFFLFGSEAVNCHASYEADARIDDVALSIQLECDFSGFATFFYEHGTTSPMELLNKYDGWNAFCEISEELYKRLQP
jgi:hypothetical protein